jgi:hypothetical protein
MASANLFQSQAKFTARVSSSRAAVQKQSRWVLRGNKYIQGFGAPRPDAFVQHDPAIEAAAIRAIEAIAPTIAAAFERHLAPVAEAAFDAWPVDTGLSKSLLYLRFRPVLSDTAFQGTIGNTAPYGRFIKYGKSLDKRKRSTSSTAEYALVVRPGKLAAEAMMREIADSTVTAGR